MIFESASPEETMSIGLETAKKALPGEIYCLEGSLGAGKTVFAKGFALGLGIQEHITSPTFTIINEYSGNIKLFHFDMYRIENTDEIYDTGYEDYFYGGGVCLVEWASQVREAIPADAVWIHIEKDINKGDGYRRIVFESGGQ